MLLAVPNASEGRDPKIVKKLQGALSGGADLLDVHTDPDHNRSVFTLAADAPALEEALLAGARAAVRAIDMTKHEGLHPCIGALDVCPLVHLTPQDARVVASAALSVAERLASELAIPVFLYGELATAPERRERAAFRHGGLPALTRRMERGEQLPDFGPARPHPTAGATLVGSRPPLVAFNVELDTPDLEIAREIADRVRESGGGLPGVRAIGLTLSSGRAQVSTNVHDPYRVPLATLVAEIERLAQARDARALEAELVGLAPAAALEDYPDHVPIRGFDSALHVIENRIPPGDG